MNCTRCGTAIEATARFCPQCGTPRPQLDPRFQKVEQEVARLRDERKSGRLSEDRYKAALKEVMIKNEGRWWMLGADSGKWYVNDGAAWKEATPPLAVMESEAHPQQEQVPQLSQAHSKTDRVAVEAQAWISAKNAGTPEAYKTFLVDWPHGAHAVEAIGAIQKAGITLYKCPNCGLPVQPETTVSAAFVTVLLVIASIAVTFIIATNTGDLLAGPQFMVVLILIGCLFVLPFQYVVQRSRWWKGTWICPHCKYDYTLDSRLTEYGH